MNSDTARKGTLPDAPWREVGMGHGSVYRSCMGKQGNCGPRSPVGSTRPRGLFYCRECSEVRAARVGKVA